MTNRRSIVFNCFFISLQRLISKVSIKLERKKRILIAPLDWGLGHATRCIPIVRELLKKDCEVLIASSGRALELMRKEFPQLTTFELEGYDPQYPESGSMVLKMAFQLPKFLRVISKEQFQTERIVAQKEIDIVISDNRYGCFSRRARSVIITHQLNIQMPKWWKWLQPQVNQYNYKTLKQFSECWIPASVDSIVPALTKSETDLPVRHIGYMSRFEKKDLEKKYDVCVICSGPEPQRSIFDRMVMKQLKLSPLRSIIVRGKTETMNQYYNKNEKVTIANYLTAENMNEVIEQSEIIIARSGYSTMMDLAKLGKKAVFVPTPGQTEQELIAAELMKQHIAYVVKQADFDLNAALEESKKFSGFLNFEFDKSLLSKAIDSLL